AGAGQRTWDGGIRPSRAATPAAATVNAPPGNATTATAAASRPSTSISLGGSEHRAGDRRRGEPDGGGGEGRRPGEAVERQRGGAEVAEDEHPAAQPSRGVPRPQRRGGEGEVGDEHPAVAGRRRPGQGLGAAEEGTDQAEDEEHVGEGVTRRCRQAGEE